MEAETRTEVQLHKDAATKENRKVKGRLHAITDDSITLRLKDGQRRTLKRQDVHRVRIREPFSKGRLLFGTLSSAAGYLLLTDISGGNVLLGLSMGFGVETLGQLRMWKIYHAAHTAASPMGDRQSGTTND